VFSVGGRGRQNRERERKQNGKEEEENNHLKSKNTSTLSKKNMWPFGRNLTSERCVVRVMGL
jgi:hypothetical protein